MSLTDVVSQLLQEPQEPVSQDVPLYAPPGGRSSSMNGESRTTFSYHANFAFAIGYKGTKSSRYYIKKLFLDGELIFDATRNFRNTNYQWTFYDGDQLAADPFMRDDPQIAEALKDVRYPEMMYVVFRNLNLSQFGLRAPDVTCEMWASAGTPISIIQYEPSPITGYPVLGINWHTRRIYAPSASGNYLLTFDLDTLKFLEFKPGIHPDSATPLFFNYIPWLNWFFGSSSSNSSRITFQDANTMEVVGAIGRQSGTITSTGSVTTNDDSIRIASPNRWAYTFDARDSTTYIITRGILKRRGLTIITIKGREILRPWFDEEMGIGEIAYICSDHNRAIFYLLTTAGDVYSFNPRTRSTRLLWVNADPAFTARAIHHDPHLDVILVWHRANLPTRETVRGLRGGNGGELWAQNAQAWIDIDANTYQQYNLSDTSAGTFGFGNLSNGAVLDIATGQQRKYGIQFFGSRWDSVRYLFIGMQSGQLVNRVISPFDPDNRVPLSVFLKDIGERMGYNQNNVITVDIQDTIIGAILLDDTRPRELLSDICNFYKINMIESGKTLRFTRRETGDNINVVATIPKKAMARTGNDQASPTIRTGRLDENDIPSALTVWYLDRDADFSPVPYTAKRTAAHYDREARLNLPLVLEKATVVSLATGMLYDAWAVQVTHGFLLPPRFGHLEPGDVVVIQDGDYFDTVRLLQTTVNGDWSISVHAASVRDNSDFAIDVDETRMRRLDEGFTDGDPRSLAIILDTPLYDFSLEAEGVAVHQCVAVSLTNSEPWPGAALLYESQSVERGLIANFRRGQMWGRVLGVLGDASPCATDHFNTLRVVMPEPTALESVTEDGSLRLDYVMAVGRPGFWELLTFGEMSYSGGVATFSKLIRGRFGTDAFIPRHTTNEVAIVLSRAFAMHFVKTSDVGTIGRYTAVGVGEDINSGNITTTLISGNSKRPYEPGDIRATLVGNDLVLTWRRRDRLGFILEGWRDSGSETVPLSEASERYVLEIYNTTTGALVRSVTDLGTPSYTYTHAQQVADGYIRGDRVRMRVAQFSAEVGPGFNVERFVNVNV